MRRPRPHQLALSVLAVVEAATLLSGATAAATVGDRAPAPARVVGTTVVAPQVTTVRPAPVSRPAAAKPRPRHTAAPSHRTAHKASRPAVRRTAVRPVHRTARSPQEQMRQAISRLPGYRPGVATWVMTSRFGHWGVADLGLGIIYIDPGVPSNRMYDVVAHEWSHVLSMRDYGMDVSTAVADLNRVFGGSGLTGAEKAADCMARVLGARWTHYTPCASTAWRAAARKLLSGQRL